MFVFSPSHLFVIFFPNIPQKQEDPNMQKQNLYLLHFSLLPFAIIHYITWYVLAYFVVEKAAY